MKIKIKRKEKRANRKKFVWIYLYPSTEANFQSEVFWTKANIYRHDGFLLSKFVVLYWQLQTKHFRSYITFSLSVVYYHIAPWILGTTVKTTAMSKENSSNFENEVKDAATLSELFDKAFDLFNNIDKSNEPTNSSKFQVLYHINTLRIALSDTLLCLSVQTFSEITLSYKYLMRITFHHLSNIDI